MRILESGAQFDTMVLMMQREVAERLVAAPGGRTNGSITIKVQHYCSVEVVMDVPPEAFLPPPEVHSQVVRFRLRESADTGTAPEYFRLVDAGFMHRRKTLANAVGMSNTLACNRKQVEEALKAMGLPATTRAEQLGVGQFQTLHQLLKR